MHHPDAPRGQLRKYARAERERRFLLAEVPTGACIRRAAITDVYLAGARVRLRRTVETMAGTTTTVRKLTQKIPAPGGGPGLITNFYLNESEYDVFAGLPGTRLEKTRFSVPPFGVDVFKGPLQGLLVAEIEFATARAQRAFPAPPGTVEVTLDPRVTGGRLCMMERPEMLAVLLGYGLAPLDASDLETRELAALDD